MLRRYSGGERGIRTPGPVTVNGFQDRRIRPLCQLSGCESANYKAFLRILKNLIAHKDDSPDLFVDERLEFRIPDSCVVRPLKSNGGLPACWNDCFFNCSMTPEAFLPTS